MSSYYGFDSQTSARILVSTAGLVIDSYSWKAFGEAVQSGSGTVNPYGYIANGLYYAEMPDLINAWNRWPQASVGQFLSRVGFEQQQAGEHPYGYAYNNPILFNDPSGNNPDFANCYQTEFARICANASPPYNVPNSACEGAKSICGNPFASQPDCNEAACPHAGLDPIQCGLSSSDSFTVGFCVSCAWSIHNTWSQQQNGKLTWYHDCNHLFIHCMSCCFLTRRVDPHCAASSQDVQDRASKGKHTYPLGPGGSSACRLPACASGIAAGLNTSRSCISQCLQTYPFNGGPTCSSKKGTRHDCNGRNLTELPYPPGC